MRTHVFWTSAAIVAAWQLAGCTDSTTPGEPEGARVAPLTVSPPASCPSCVVTPTTLFRRANAVPYVVEFAADPNADYLLFVQDDGHRETTAQVMLNGGTVLDRRALLGSSASVVRLQLSVGLMNRLAIRPEGVSGASVTLWVIGGGRLIDSTGGIVRAPRGLGELSIPPGAIQGNALAVQLFAAPADPQTRPSISPSPLRLEVPLAAAGTTVANGHLLTLRTPVLQQPPVGALIAVRSTPAGGTESFWSTASLDVSGRAELSLPTQSLSALAKALGTATIDLTLETHAFAPSPPLATSFGRAAAARIASPLSSYCPALPDFAPIGDYAPCNETLLHFAPTSAPAANDAIILVHGWHGSVGDGLSYLNTQGINCYSGSCTKLPGTHELPGGAYFKDLIQRLTTDFQQVGVYTFSYESFRPVSETGAALAADLQREQALRRFNRIILVGHSMGGLVARVAAQVAPTGTLPISGIITMGTPHLGTELASITAPAWLRGLQPGLGTPGFLSLGNRLNRLETTPLFLHAGDATAKQSLSRRYRWGLVALCGLPGPCESDGVVPVASALADNDPLFTDASITRHAALQGYDHSDMNGGKAPLLSDALYLQVKADISAILGSTLSPPSNATAQAAGSQWIDVAWADNSNDEDFFQVEYSLSPTGPFFWNQTGPNVTSATIGALATGARHYIRVAALRGSTLSPYSSLTSASTLSEGHMGGTAGAVMNGQLFVIGAQSANGSFAWGDISSYTPATDTWSHRTRYGSGPGFGAWSSPSGAVPYQGRIYMPGGAASGSAACYRELLIFDPSTNSVTTGPQDHPVPTCRGSAGEINGQLYVYSQQINPLTNIATTSFYAYDLSAQTWSAPLPTPPSTVYYGNGVVVGDKFFLVGGHDSATFALTGKVSVYSVATGQWTTLPSAMPTPRASAAVVSDGRFIYVAGGYRGGPAACGYAAEVESYDTVTGSWAVLPSLRQARWAPVAGVLNNKLYVTGGEKWCGGIPGDVTSWIEIVKLP